MCKLSSLVLMAVLVTVAYGRQLPESIEGIDEQSVLSDREATQSSRSVETRLQPQFKLMVDDFANKVKQQFSQSNGQLRTGEMSPVIVGLITNMLAGMAQKSAGDHGNNEKFMRVISEAMGSMM